MKKKIIILLLTVFFITGCTPKITLDLKNDKITENISFTTDKEHTSSWLKENIEMYGISKEKNYNFDITDTGSNYNIDIKKDAQNIEDYFDNKKSILETCFNNSSFVYDKDEDSYYFGTSTGYNCMTYDYLETGGLDFVLKTYNKVTKNNADEVKGNTYTWHINDTNYFNSSIMFVISKNKYIWYYQYRFLIIGLITIAAIFLIIYLVVKIFAKSSDRANKI